MPILFGTGRDIAATPIATVDQFKTALLALRDHGLPNSHLPNPQRGWPRVGVASDNDVSVIVDALAQKLVEAE